jgi:hypothetical protein
MDNILWKVENTGSGQRVTLVVDGIAHTLTPQAAHELVQTQPLILGPWQNGRRLDPRGQSRAETHYWSRSGWWWMLLPDGASGWEKTEEEAQQAADLALRKNGAVLAPLG